MADGMVGALAPINQDSRRCPVCGTAVEVKPRGRKRIYCSDKCRDLGHHPRKTETRWGVRIAYSPVSRTIGHCRTCGRSVALTKAQKYCSEACRKHVRSTQVSCIQCGKPRRVVTRLGRTDSGYCKRCTCLRAASIKSEVQAIRRIAVRRPRCTSKAYARWYAQHVAKPKPRSPRLQIPRLGTKCEQCGKPLSYTNPRYKPRFCSRSCLGKILKTRGRKPTMSRRCKACDVEFSPLPSKYQTVTCSDECADFVKRQSKGDSKRKRRVNERDNAYAIDPVAYYVSALQIFKRDGWKCQGCGCDTPRSLRGTQHDDAPELDHIVPVCDGGSHTDDNLQCLCRTCNALKSSMSMSSFLRWSCSSEVRHIWNQ
jgi:endogenous inhibitor of DNA gyrase (YacG/DUF329 family)